MKSSLALTLFFIDLFGGITVLILSISAIASAPSIRKLSQIEKIPNLRGSKLNLSEILSTIKSQEKKDGMKLSNLDLDEFVLSHKQISSKSSPKRKLEESSKSGNDTMLFVLLLNLLALHFTFVIGFSFLVDQKECCNNFNEDICCVFALFIFNFSIAYYSTKACGKHASRYVGITFVMLISFVNLILGGDCLSSGAYNNTITYAICIISLLMTDINLFGLLLPCCCSSLRYVEEPIQQPILPSMSQLPSYIPPSSDFANVPNYPPTPNNPEYPSGYSSSGYYSSQGNIYDNPQPIPLQSV